MSKLTKEEAQMYLDDLKVIICESNDCKKFFTYFTYRDCKKCRSNRNFEGIQQLINEHFELLEKYKALQDENGRLNFNNIANNINDMNYKLWLENSPLKLEELKEGMWVFDNQIKKYRKISRIEGNKLFFDSKLGVNFKEDKFYRKEVEEC